MPAVTQDIELWVKNLGDQNFGDAVKSIGARYIPAGFVDLNPTLIAGQDLRGIDLVTTCQGLNDFDSEASKAIKVTMKDFEVLVLPLERIIISKEAAGRPKDISVLPVLRSTLKVI